MNEVLKKNKFDILREKLSPTELPISSALKEKAEELLAHSDFPTRRDEAWKYTSVNGLNKLLLDGNTRDSLKPHIISNDSEKVYIVNGIISEGQSETLGI